HDPARGYSPNDPIALPALQLPSGALRGDFWTTAQSGQSGKNRGGRRRPCPVVRGRRRFDARRTFDSRSGDRLEQRTSYVGCRPPVGRCGALGGGRRGHGGGGPKLKRRCLASCRPLDQRGPESGALCPATCALPTQRSGRQGGGKRLASVADIER